jgi:hypothetical protein
MAKSTNAAARILVAGVALWLGIGQAFAQKEAGAEGVRAASKAFYAALAVCDFRGPAQQGDGRAGRAEEVLA